MTATFYQGKCQNNYVKYNKRVTYIGFFPLNLRITSRIQLGIICKKKLATLNNSDDFI